MSTPPIARGKWMATNLIDLLGVEYQLGDRVVKADISGRAANIRISIVTRIENGKMYLDESKVAINYPGRMLIVNKLFD